MPAGLYTGDRLTCCLIGGAICGAGTGIGLWAATAGGGTDLVGLMLIKRNNAFSVGKLNLIVDIILYIICLVMFDIQVAIYSIIYAAVCTFITDKLHQQNINVQAIIVSDAPAEQLQHALIEKMDRGFTKLPGRLFRRRKDSLSGCHLQI